MSDTVARQVYSSGYGPGGFEIPAKVWSVFLFTQWARSAVPRLLIDQVIAVGWKGLLVLAFANLLLTAVVVGLVA